jgi:hypothetical protein
LDRRLSASSYAKLTKSPLSQQKVERKIEKKQKTKNKHTFHLLNLLASIFGMTSVLVVLTEPEMHIQSFVPAKFTLLHSSTTSSMYQDSFYPVVYQYSTTISAFHFFIQ